MFYKVYKPYKHALFEKAHFYHILRAIITFYNLTTTPGPIKLITKHTFHTV